MIGTNLAITTKNYSVAGGVTYDADALAYFTANTAITSDADKNAINTFYLGLKSDGIYTKIKQMGLYIWSSATNNKWNLINPQDTNAAYRLTYSTGWTHASNGMTGTNAYANTQLIPNTALTVRNTHLSVYMRTNTTAANKTEIGAGNITTANPSMALATRYTGNITFTDAYSTSTNRISVSNSDRIGFYIGTRTAINSAKIYKNGSSIVSNTTNETNNAMPNVQLSLGAYNFGGSYTQYTDGQFAFSSIGDGLTDTEASNLSNRVNTLMTYFGINVY